MKLRFNLTVNWSNYCLWFWDLMTEKLSLCTPEAFHRVLKLQVCSLIMEMCFIISKNFLFILFATCILWSGEGFWIRLIVHPSRINFVVQLCSILLFRKQYIGVVLLAVIITSSHDIYFRVYVWATIPSQMTMRCYLKSCWLKENLLL